MPFLGGTITYKKFRVLEEVPKNFKDSVAHNLPKHTFREINPKTNPEFSIGWVNSGDPMDSRLNLEKIIFGKYIIMGIRRDKKSVQPAMLKAKLSEAIRAQMRERKGRKLSREEMAGLKDTVKEQMLASISPNTAFFEMVWNYETQEVYFSSQSAKATEDFLDLFQETFELTLEDFNLVARTEFYISDKGLELELADIEASHFGA